MRGTGAKGFQHRSDAEIDRFNALIEQIANSSESELDSITAPHRSTGHAGFDSAEQTDRLSKLANAAYAARHSSRF
jgi:hypothetical protein